MSNIPGCVVVEVDGKTWEAHCDVWQLQEEHKCYAAAYPGQDSLKRVLAKQLANFGVTKHGVKFSREGGRASGDFNTGMGNSVIMVAVVVSTCVGIGLRTFDTLVDGDNALLFLRPEDLALAQREFYNYALRTSGHEIVLERPEVVLERVRFGQSAPVEVAGKWTMVRDWKKILSHGTSNHAHLRDLPFAYPWLRGVARCELSLARGLPIVQRWAESILRSTEGSVELSLDNYRDYQAMGVAVEEFGDDHLEEVAQSTRESFSRAFGVEVDRQLAIERELVGLPKLSAWVCQEAPVPDGWWDVDPGLCEYFLE